MSITVRTWTNEELQLIRTGKDKWLATIFLNCDTLSGREILNYPFHLRRTYQCIWETEGETGMESRIITVYATDTEMLRRFLETEYTRLPDKIYEVVVQHNLVKI